MTAESVSSPAASKGDAAPTGALTRYRWVVCALLFFATTINYIDRQILALIKEILDKAPADGGLGWTNAQYGEVNAVFQGFYAMGLLAFGWFVDRYGTKIGYSVSIIAWSIAAVGHALVSSVTGFKVARASLGLGEGGNFPSSIKAVAQWFPKRERALATSIFNAGTNVGAIVAPAIVPFIALRWGWQSAFVAAGIAGFVWLAFWLPMYVANPETSARVSAGEVALIRSDADAAQQDQGRRVSWLSLLGYRETWSFIVAKFMTDPVWWFFLIWLPDFFKKTYALDIKKSWLHLVTIYTIITVLSIMGGWITGYLTRHGWSVTRARKTGMFLFACLVVPVFVATSMGVWAAVLLISLAGAAHQAWSANLFTTVSDMFPKRAVASVIGIGGMAGAIGGILFPIFCGRKLDEFKALGNEAGAYTYLLHLLAFAYLVTFAIHHLLAPKLEQVTIKD